FVQKIQLGLADPDPPSACKPDVAAAGGAKPAAACAVSAAAGAAAGGWGGIGTMPDGPAGGLGGGLIGTAPHSASRAAQRGDSLQKWRFPSRVNLQFLRGSLV